MAATLLRKCLECGGDVPRPGRQGGRQRKYCSGTCKNRARERRRTGWQAIGELATLPTDPATARRRTAEALLGALEGLPAGPPEDRLAQWLIEGFQWAFSGRRIADDLPPALRARVIAVVMAASATLENEFGDVAGVGS